MSSPQRVPGVKLLPPKPAPQPGEHLLGYEVYEPEVGCCKCHSLRIEGAIAVIILTMFMPCFACIPCCMDSLHEPFQRPVYGSPSHPSMQAGRMVMGQPAAAPESQPLKPVYRR